MIGPQVDLSEEQRRALRRAAGGEGISMTAFLRLMVERELLGKFRTRGYAKQAVMALANPGRSARSDIADNHDEGLADAFRNEPAR